MAALFLLTTMAAHAGAPILVSLAIDPATVKEGSDHRTLLKTTVTLQAPSPTYFVCEVRSREKRKLDCTNIIFKKGDTQGKGTATVLWDSIAADSSVKVTAFNVDAPDSVVTFTVNLQVKGERTP